MDCPQCVYGVLAPMRSESIAPLEYNFGSRNLIRFFENKSVFQVAVNIGDVVS